MTEDRTTQTDLQWWLAMAPTLEWTFATTYAKSAPHSYIVNGRTAGMTAADYVRAAHVIHTFGQPAKFYSRTSIYLTSPDGRLKWWTMDPNLDETGLINQATTDRLYGVQNAPSTQSESRDPRDELATRYDSFHPIADGEVESLRDLIAPYRSAYPPSVLDLGCGTGRLLDLGLTTADRYAGVDPSQPMLNMLVRKHPTVAAVYPMTIEAALTNRLFTPLQFEIVAMPVPPVRDRVGTIEQVRRIASRVLIIGRGDGAEVLSALDASDQHGITLTNEPGLNTKIPAMTALPKAGYAR